ncbi:hypothetical protein AGIG_G25242 [Arapaima gigas]
MWSCRVQKSKFEGSDHVYDRQSEFSLERAGLQCLTVGSTEQPPQRWCEIASHLAPLERLRFAPIVLHATHIGFRVRFLAADTIYDT